MSTNDPIESINKEADHPLGVESNPRKAIKMDGGRGVPYYVHPKASLVFARELWNDADRERSPLYDASKPEYQAAETVQEFVLSEDATTYIYEAQVEELVWGEVRGAVVDTFLGVAKDAAVLIHRAEDLDLSHITPDE